MKRMFKKLLKLKKLFTNTELVLRQTILLISISYLAAILGYKRVASIVLFIVMFYNLCDLLICIKRIKNKN